VVANSQGIVTRLLGSSKGLTPDVARKMLDWKFNDRDQARVAALLVKNRENTISREELSELNTFVVLGDLLDVLHAQAELSLQKAPRKRQRAR
jgi:hypothetical protein